MSEKKKRPDKAIKLQQRKDTSETVVKCCLLKHLHGDGKTKAKIKAAITSRVLAFSERYQVASIALCHIIKKVFDGHQDVTTVITPDIFDITFIRQLMLGLDSAVKPFQVVKDYIREHPELYTSIQRYIYDRNIYSFGSTLYLTNLKNHLKLNLPGVIKKLCRSIENCDSVAMWYCVHGLNPPKNVGAIFPQPQEFYTSVSDQRRVLALSGDSKIDYDWMANEGNLMKMLKYFVFSNRLFAQLEKPQMNIVPISRTKCHYITIDTSVLEGIMRDAELIDKKANSSFVELSNDHWKSFLKYERLQGSDNKFTKTIQSDGTLLCVHFIRPKNLQDEAFVKKGKKGRQYIANNDKLKIKLEDRVIAIDPGRTNIIYATEQQGDKYQRHVLTRLQYYTESGIFKARKQTQKWTDPIQERLNELSKVSTKGVDLQKHNEYLATYLQHKDALWTTYTEQKWSRQRFRLYGGKKRTIATFFNDVEKKGDPNKRIILAYGSSCTTSGGVGEMSVPVSKVFQYCRQRYAVKLIDEYRTTKVCSIDDSVLHSVQRRDTGERLRGLLWCGSTNVNKFINRDLNAAINILRIARLPSRPASLTRDHPKVVMRVGKIIKC